MIKPNLTVASPKQLYDVPQSAFGAFRWLGRLGLFRRFHLNIQMADLTGDKTAMMHRPDLQEREAELLEWENLLQTRVNLDIAGRLSEMPNNGTKLLQEQGVKPFVIGKEAKIIPE